MIQELIVLSCVALAASYLVWKYLPAALRTRAAARLSTLATRAGLGGAHAAALEKRLASVSRCGGCDGCATTKSCGSPLTANHAGARVIPLRAQ